MAGNDQRGSDGRRPTKAERREDARRQREDIQRRMARRRRNRTIGLVLVALAVATAVVAVFLTSGGSGISSASDLLKEAPAAVKTAGCDAVQSTPNYQDAPGEDPEIDHGHFGSTSELKAAPPLSTYPTTPPASGPHDPTPLLAGIYSAPPDVYSSIHALEHGGTIIWYAAGTSGEQLDQLLAFYGQPLKEANVGQDRVIIAPYDYPGQGTASLLPSGAQMALVSWHRLQTCSNVDLAVAFDFTSQYEYPVWDGRTYEGVAREPGGAM